MKFFFFIISLLFCVNGYCQDSIALVEKAKEFQQKLNEEYADKEKSPLKEEDLKTFTALEFFKINPQFIVIADFVRTPYEQAFVMPTTTDRKPIYVKYGEVHFVLKGAKYQLNVYQNQHLMTDPQYKDYLFIPFTDLTNGEETYGGGRYIDFLIPKANKVVLDFNQAYNPYCAYNAEYSCPIPPQENNLAIAVEAGVKKPA